MISTKQKVGRKKFSTKVKILGLLNVLVVVTFLATIISLEHPTDDPVAGMGSLVLFMAGYIILLIVLILDIVATLLYFFRRHIKTR